MGRIQQGLLAVILIYISACSTNHSSTLENLATLLSAGNIDGLSRVIHDDYADPLGGREQLIADLADMRRHFDSIDVKFRELEPQTRSSATNSQIIAAKIEAQIAGNYSWKFKGKVELEMSLKPSTQIRSGLLSNVRDIINLMNTRIRAIEGNSEKAYVRVLHPNYRRGDENLVEVQARIKRSLQGKLRIRPDRYIVDLEANQAHVTEWATSSQSLTHPRVSSSTTTTTSGYRSGAHRLTKSEFTLRKSAGQWLIHAIHGQF